MTTVNLSKLFALAAPVLSDAHRSNTSNYFSSAKTNVAHVAPFITEYVGLTYSQTVHGLKTKSIPAMYRAYVRHCEKQDASPVGEDMYCNRLIDYIDWFL